jgi:integrase
MLREELTRQKYRLRVYKEKFQADPGSEFPREIQFGLLGLSEKSQELYIGEWKRADAYFEKEGKTLNDESLSEYVLWRFREKGHAPSSIVIGVRALSWRAKKLGEESPYGEKSQNVLKLIKRQGVGRSRGKVRALLLKGVSRMLEACEADSRLWGRRDAAVIRLAFDAGLRISEVEQIQASEVDQGPDGKPRLYVSRSKTDQDGTGTYQPIGPEALALV